MTQELIVWALLFSVVGLLWIFTCGILTKGNRSRLSRSIHESQRMKKNDRPNAETSREKVAA